MPRAYTSPFGVAGAVFSLLVFSLSMISILGYQAVSWEVSGARARPRPNLSRSSATALSPSLPTLIASLFCMWCPVQPVVLLLSWIVPFFIYYAVFGWKRRSASPEEICALFIVNT